MARPKKKKRDEVRTERIIFNVTPSTLKKIDELSDKLRIPRSQFMNHLTEIALEDQEFIINVISKTILPAKDLLDSLTSRLKKA